MTEVIHDNLSPAWVKKIQVDFHFEQQEQYKVEVYDSDDDSQQVQDLSKHDFIGYLEFQLHEVNTARDQKLTKPLNNQQRGPNRNGNITL